jgi:hypothetical protein
MPGVHIGVQTLSELLQSRCHFRRIATIGTFKKGLVNLVTKIDQRLSKEDPTLQYVEFLLTGLVLPRHVELEWELFYRKYDNRSETQYISSASR